MYLLLPGWGPYWDMYARGTIVDYHNTNRNHIARAVLSIVFQTTDMFEAMKADSGYDILELKVDGGAMLAM